MKHTFLFLLVFMVTFVGCRKDSIDDISDTTIIVTPDPGFDVTAKITGIVTTTTGEPIANTTVQLGQETVTTDQYGYFRFEEMLVPKEGGLLTFTKAGYFENYKFVSPAFPGKTYTVRVMMAPREQTGTFETATGGSIGLPSGAVIEFSPNSIVDKNGQPYVGNVTVYAYWYNPKSDAINKLMPGDLRGINTQGNEVQLATYGMMAVELQSTSGEDLNLAEETTATLKFPLLDFSTEAPQSVPLWSLNETTGTWIEDGTAVKSGDYYIGEVSHFSFWNCDAPFPLVHLSGVIKDTQGNVLPYTSICFEIEGGNPNSWFNSAYGWTNEAGEFYGKIPKDKPLRLTIKDECGNVVYNELVGPFSEDTNLGMLIVDIPGAINLSGTIVDCDGNIVTDGYVLVTYPSSWNPDYLVSTIVEVNEGGGFSFVSLYCGATEITVQGFDYATATYSEEVTVTVQSGAEVDLGMIYLCEQLDEYIQYTLNGGDITLLPTADLCIIDGNATFNGFFQQTPNGQGFANFTINSIALGSNTAASVQFYPTNFSLVASCDGNCEDLLFDVTTLGTSIDDYVIGTFSGEVSQDSLGASGNVQVEGSFKVRIDYIGQGSSISGVVWTDTNGDGIRQGTEPLRENEYVYLSSGSTLNSFVLTNAAGEYSFSGLKAGTYGIYIEANGQYTGYQQGGDTTVDNDFTPNGAQVVLLEGENATNIDAGFTASDPLTCSAQGFGCLQVFGEIFINASGGLPPYTYSLIAPAPEFPMSSTQNYFSGLQDGTYEVLVSDQSGQQCSTIVTVVSEPAYQQGFIWEDLNGDSLYTELDTLANVEGIVIELYDEFGNLINTYTTGQFAWFDFNILYPGGFYIKVKTPAGYVLVNPSADPGNQQTTDITPDASDPSMGQSQVFWVEECLEQQNILNIGIQEE